jgi:hypothetical protein
MRQKRCRPLGVLEFTSALNGDDNYLILSKLRHFVTVVSYERRLALFSSSSSSSTDETETTKDHDHRVTQQQHEERESYADVQCNLFDECFNEDEDDDDDVTIQPSSTKRHKSSSTSEKQEQTKQLKLPSWTNDTNNYGNPFIGTTIATPYNESYGTVITGQWPTGFILQYIQHSPLGIELVNNDYVTKLYTNSSSSNNNISSSEGNNNSKTKKGSSSRILMEGGVDTMAIQYYHWVAIYEWLLGYIPANSTLHYHSEVDDWPLMHDNNNNNTYDANELVNMEDYENESQQQPKQQKQKGSACCQIIPSTVMTILIKNQLPEWINAIREYVIIRNSNNNKSQSKLQHPHKLKKQQQPQRNVSSSSSSIAPLAVSEKQRQREELLLLACLRNLIALCHLSDGTYAREVLRKLTIGTISTNTSITTDNDNGGCSKKENASSRGGGKGKGTIHRPTTTTSGADGTLWMEHLFRYRSSLSTSSITTSLSSCTMSYQVRIECLKLICTLLETKDDAILSRLIEIPPSTVVTISSSAIGKQQRSYSKKGEHSTSSVINNNKGSNNEKKNYGLAYIALRYGMHELFELGKNDDVDDDIIHQRHKGLFARYMTRLLQDIRTIILASLDDCKVRSSNNDGRKRSNTALGIDVKADLFTTDIINNLTKLSSLAPSFEATNKSIQSIMNATDRYDNLNFIEVASVEARRILFILLLDTRRSPFLLTIHRSNNSKVARQQVRTSSIATNDKEDRSRLLLSQLAITLHAILSNNYQQYSPSSKVLLRMCLQGTPELVPHYFHGLQLLDSKMSYGSLSAIVFVEDVVRISPLPSLDSVALLSVDDLLSAIIPPCITRTLLGKIIQNSSALLVSSGLKLIITLLRRVHDFVSIMSSTTTTTIDRYSLKKNSLLQEIICHLPDVALLLSIPARFDPFEYHQPLASSSSSSSSTSNSFVVLLLCKTLECYAQLDSTLLTGVKFDWSKLVPNNTNNNNNDDQQTIQHQGRIFSHAEPLLQLRILYTLLLLTRINNMPSFSSKMLPNVMSVLISTIIPAVYCEARKLALILLERELFSDMMISSNSKSSLIGEDGQCSNYESSLWIDGMSCNIIDKFIKLIDESKQVQVEQKIMISQALSEALLFGKSTIHARLGVSSLLVWIISRLLKDEAFAVSNKQLSLLALQVATKMLLYVADPSLFAAFIYHCSAHGGEHEDKRINDLCNVAKHILNKDHKTNLLMESLTSELFAPSNVQLMNADKQEDAQIANVSNIRQFLFKIKFSVEHDEDLHANLRKMLISIIEVRLIVSSFPAPSFKSLLFILILIYINAEG